MLCMASAPTPFNLESDNNYSGLISLNPLLVDFNKLINRAIMSTGSTVGSLISLTSFSARDSDVYTDLKDKNKSLLAVMARFAFMF